MTTEVQSTPKLFYEDVQVGDAVPALVKSAISLTQLVRYAGASGDFNPLHYDPKLGESIGTGGVIAHGMLIMGIAGQTLSDYVGPGALRKFGVRFKSMTHIGDVLTCKGVVTEKYEADGEARIAGTVEVADQNGDVKLSGNFVSALPHRNS